MYACRCGLGGIQIPYFRGKRGLPPNSSASTRHTEAERYYPLEPELAGSSYRWQDFYDQRGAVEWVNSRLAGGFGFEQPGIRGLAKMQLRISMALTIMLAMAIGRIRAGQPENLRSLVRPA